MKNNIAKAFHLDFPVKILVGDRGSVSRLYTEKLKKEKIHFVELSGDKFRVLDAEAVLVESRLVRASVPALILLSFGVYSPDAISMLLKTLEDVPASLGYVIFVESKESLLATVLSRGVVFDIKVDDVLLVDERHIAFYEAIGDRCNIAFVKSMLTATGGGEHDEARVRVITFLDGFVKYLEGLDAVRYTSVIIFYAEMREGVSRSVSHKMLIECLGLLIDECKNYKV